MPQFDVSKYFSLIFWFVLCFTYLIYFVKSRLIPKMEGLLEARYFKIQKEKKNIESLKKEIDDIRKSNDLKIEAAKKDVDAILDNAKKEIEQDRAQKLKRLDIEIQERMVEFDHELKWQMDAVKSQFEEDLIPYVETLKKKIVPLGE